MNTRPTRRAARPAGFTLIEILVYLALFVVVTGYATRTVYECWDGAKALRQNSEQVARALDIGERWRADVRGASGPVQVTKSGGGGQCRIPSTAGEIIYTFAKGEIRRQAGAGAPNTLWLSEVESSQMETEARGGAAAWRWELELREGSREARGRPLFTFECAAGSASLQ